MFYLFFQGLMNAKKEPFKSQVNLKQITRQFSFSVNDWHKAFEASE